MYQLYIKFRFYHHDGGNGGKWWRWWDNRCNILGLELKITKRE